MADKSAEALEARPETNPTQASLGFMEKWGARLPVLFTATYGPAATGFQVFMSAMYVKAGAYPEAAIYGAGSVVLAGLTVGLTRHIWSLGSEGNGQSQ